jgi:hypothetical protein
MSNRTDRICRRKSSSQPAREQLLFIRLILDKRFQLCFVDHGMVGSGQWKSFLAAHQEKVKGRIRVPEEAPIAGTVVSNLAVATKAETVSRDERPRAVAGPFQVRLIARGLGADATQTPQVNSLKSRA